jgi:hypothetical protein
VATSLDNLVDATPQDCARVSRSDLYSLLDKLTTMQTNLMSVWDPDATVHPTNDSKRRLARDALHAAIADLRVWIEQGESLD